MVRYSSLLTEASASPAMSCNCIALLHTRRGATQKPKRKHEQKLKSKAPNKQKNEPVLAS